MTLPVKFRAAPLLMLTLLFMVALVCREKHENNGHLQSKHNFPPELTEFIPYGQNPVLSGTGEDTWDKNIRERGYILREDDGYHLWYTGYNKEKSDTMRLGYATSPDGFVWTRYPENPIFSGSWVEDMCVVKDGGAYYMFAEGQNDIAHLLTSTDRVHWEDHGSLDIRGTNGEPISPGPYGTPAIWIEGDMWILFYERNDSGIWSATSRDRKIWRNIQDEPVIAAGPEIYDREAVAMNQVIKYNGTYYCVYHASGNRPWSDWTTCMAASSDLIHWEKFPGNPVVQGGDKSSGILIWDGARFRLYTMHPDVNIFLAKEIRNH